VKYLLLLIFSIPNFANAASCKQLRQDLLAIDYKLNFELCDKAKEQTCRHKGPYHELLLEYNKAMARLIIEEGIMAIGQSIENSHNSLSLLKKVNLDKAQSYFTKLEDSLAKATLLEKAMDPTDQITKTRADGSTSKISMWSPSQIPDSKLSNFKKFKSHISQVICNDMNSKKICKEIFKTESEEKRDVLLKTLHGFVMADREIIRTESSAASSVVIHDTNPTSRYEDYVKKWEIRSISNEKLSVESIKEAVKSQDNLKRHIAAYKENKTEENARRLIDEANKLKPISVSYASNSSDGVHKFLNENIRKLLMGTQQAIGGISDNILTDQFKENLSNQRDVISQTHDLLEAEINERRKIDPQSKTTLDFNETELEKHKELGNKLSIIGACYNSQKSATEKKECLIRERSSLYKSSSPNAQQTHLKTLKEDLQKVKSKLSYHNNLPPFKDFLTQKALVVNELSKPKCKSQIKNKNIELTSSAYCNADYKDTILDVKTISMLNSSGQEVILHLQNEFVSEALNAGLPQEKISEYKNELKVKCAVQRENQKEHIKNVCRHFSAGTVRDKPKKRTRSEKRRRSVIHLDQVAVEKTSDSTIFWNTFLQGSVQQLPDLVTSWAGYDQTKNWRNTELQNIQAKENYYLATKDYRDAYMTELNASRAAQPEYYTYQNYGAPYMQNGYNVQSTFQSQNTDQIYNSVNDPIQNMFNAPTTLTPPPESFSPGQVNFSYDLST
jgi:hypothetical protein